MFAKRLAAFRELGEHRKFVSTSDKVRVSELMELVSVKNGFYCLDGAVLFRPMEDVGKIKGQRAWNDKNGWKKDLKTPYLNAHFFAEDLFANQIGVLGKDIILFDLNSLEIVNTWSSMDEFLDALQMFFSWQRNFVRKWIQENGPIDDGKRLFFWPLEILGGKTQVDTCRSVDADRLVRFMIEVVGKVKALPNGTRVQIDWVP